MNGIKRAIRDFFGFTRSQTNGFVALNLIVLLALLLEPLTRWWISLQENNFSQEQTFLDSLILHWEPATGPSSDSTSSALAINYFNFNPNQSTSEELQSLGFSKALTQRIINYRSKGGVFRVKSDLKKMYGMDTVLYFKLLPYILLPDKIQYETRKYEVEKKPAKVLFDLNTADTTQLKAIYGIGPVLAKRIITFRDKLGGFVNTHQLKEVYKLDTAVIKRIEAASYIDPTFQPRKLNINSADVITLQQHPYINERIAKAIIAYRFQHGIFKSVEELKQVKLVDEALFMKVYPYVSIE